MSSSTEDALQTRWQPRSRGVLRLRRRARHSDGRRQRPLERLSRCRQRSQPAGGSRTGRDLDFEHGDATRVDWHLRPTADHDGVCGVHGVHLNQFLTGGVRERRGDRTACRVEWFVADVPGTREGEVSLQSILQWLHEYGNVI